jgi:hypothetical protein
VKTHAIKPGPKGGVRGKRPKEHSGKSNRFKYHWATKAEMEAGLGAQPPIARDFVGHGGTAKRVMVVGVIEASDRLKMNFTTVWDPDEELKPGEAPHVRNWMQVACRGMGLLGTYKAQTPASAPAPAAPPADA